MWLLRGHPAWKEQFDALQTPKTDEEAAMKTKMWQDLCTLHDCSYITREVCGQIAHSFYRDQDQQVSFLDFLWCAMLICVCSVTH